MLPTRLCNVLKVSDDSQLTIVLKYQHETTDRLFTFKRTKHELLSDLVKRMQINLEKIFNKGKKDTPKAEFNISFIQHQPLSNLEVKNDNFWINGSQVQINNQLYEIKVNLPFVVDIQFSRIVLSDYLIYPHVDIINGDILTSHFKWFKSKDSTDWISIGSGFFYEVKEEDIGYLLKVTCVPSNGCETGVEKEAISCKPVIKGPSCPFELRQKTTSILPEDSSQFRVVSYNLLADIYADSKYSQESLFSYCKPKYLSFDYRKLLILKELIGYNSDIYFVQELDKGFFDKGLSPIFQQLNYGAHFLCKKQMVEGLAILYRESKFTTIRTESNSFIDLLDENELFRFLKEKLNHNLYTRMVKLKNNFQIVLLRSKSDESKLVLCCNLHLYSKDDADHIRLLQSYICFKFIEKMLVELKHVFLSHKIAVLISGDFNSTPEFGVLKLAQDKRVDSSLEDFRSNEDEIVEGVCLEHGLDLFSACGFPDYTNYTENFVGCLDYIFADSSHLTVLEVVPFQKHEDVIREKAIPSELFPSDHLALVCTLRWI